MALRNEASQKRRYHAITFSERNSWPSISANPPGAAGSRRPDYARKAMVRSHIYPDHEPSTPNIIYLRWPNAREHNLKRRYRTRFLILGVNESYLHKVGTLVHQPKSVLGYDPSAKMDRYSFRGEPRL